jgi:signal transduction histidine kinase
MPPEVRDHAFERFWRTPDATGKGFGLGLAIVEQLAHSCGGDARLDPGPDEHGLDAVVRLRVGAVPPGRTGARRAEKPNPALTSG